MEGELTARGRKGPADTGAEQCQSFDRFVAEDKTNVAVGDLPTPATHRCSGDLLGQQAIRYFDTVEAERRDVEEQRPGSRRTHHRKAVELPKRLIAPSLPFRICGNLMRMSGKVLPRIFCIPALKAPTVAVITRGPSAWFHLGKWDLDRPEYEPGAWIKANLYPQRCDLSLDGRWFCYFTLKPSAKWQAGSTYVAISRLPWLTALAAWGTCGTWTRGLHFLEDKRVWQVGEPDEGNLAQCRGKIGIAVTEPATFAVERRRGWTESPGTPPRDRDDIWDLRRAGELKMEKACPRSSVAMRLRVSGAYAAFRSGSPGGLKEVCYEIIENNKVTPLEHVQWADWHSDGRLLVATVEGKLQIRDRSGTVASVQSEIDLRSVTPNPLPPPEEAYRW